MRTLFAAALGFAMLLVGPTIVPAQENPIKVGAVYPMTGGAGAQGLGIIQGIKAMAEIINEDGGVLGRKLQVLTGDDESTPAVGVSRANELIAQNVSVVLEGWNSPVVLAMQPLFNRANILDFTTGAKADAILSGEGNPLHIRIGSPNDADGDVTADLIANKLKARRIAFLRQSDVFGTNAQEQIEAALKRLKYDYEVVAVEPFPFAQLDFRVAVTNVRQAKPDVTLLINASAGAGMPALIRQVRELRVPGYIVVTPGQLTDTVIPLAGPAANGITSVGLYFANVEPFASNPTNVRFVNKVREMFKYAGDHYPDQNVAFAVTALQIWAQAASKLKTLDKVALATYIRGGSFEGTVMGDVSFLKNGQMRSRYYIFDVVGGKFVTRTQ